jgi:hypothetical protein
MGDAGLIWICLTFARLIFSALRRSKSARAASGGERMLAKNPIPQGSANEPKEHPAKRRKKLP